MSERKSPSPHAFQQASPLWTRAPARDENGKPFVDFMMLIPGLNKAPASTVEINMRKIREAMSDHGDNVVYLDLNIKLSLLWVSARPVPGISKVLVQSIMQAIPEAKVVAGDFNPENIVERKPSGLRRLGQRLMAQLRLAPPGD